LTGHSNTELDRKNQEIADLKRQLEKKDEENR
jgi:hypothetical protein